MTFGFEATNTSGQVLISDQTQNLHFFGKAGLSIKFSSDLTASNSPTAIVRTYYTTCLSNPFPFFTMPVTGTCSYGISRIYGAAGSWYIELIQGGFNSSLDTTAYNNDPEVYIFCNLANRPITLAGDSNGLIVYGSNGTANTRVFDSRYIPLVVTAGFGNAYPPSNPYDNAIQAQPGVAGYDGRNLAISAHSNGYSYNSAEIVGSFYPKNATYLSGAINNSKPIYCYSAVGQCEREQRFQDYVLWDERNYLGFGSSGRFDAACTYWYTYRSSILSNSSGLYCTWLPATRGFVGGYSRTENPSLSLASIVLGAVIGAVTGGIGAAILLGAAGAVAFEQEGVYYNSVNGSPPFSSLTLNTLSTTVLVSDGSVYDNVANLATVNSTNTVTTTPGLITRANSV